MTEPITKAEREELHRLCDAATPGPWRVDDDRVCDGRCGEPFKYNDGSVAGLIERHGGCLTIARDVESANASFIAGARTAIPRLLAALDEVEAERDTYLDQLVKFEYKAGVR